MLSQFLKEASQELTGSAWKLTKSSASDHVSFTYGGIPSVLVEQNGDGAENHRYSDKAEIVDAKKAVEAGAVIEKVIRKITSEETPSLSSQAREINSGDAFVTVTDQVPILFGASREDVEIKFGAAGALEKAEPLEGTDLTNEFYTIQTKWFDWEEPLMTEFVYMKSGQYTTIHVYGALHSTLGNDFKAFDFTKSTDEYAGQCDAVDMAMLETIHKVIPPDDPYVKQIISWTDGYSYLLGSCTADDPKISDVFSVRIDCYDFFDSEGNILDTGKMLATMVHEYGHALTLNAGQLC